MKTGVHFCFLLNGAMYQVCLISIASKGMVVISCINFFSMIVVMKFTVEAERQKFTVAGEGIYTKFKSFSFLQIETVEPFISTIKAYIFFEPKFRQHLFRKGENIDGKI